MAKRAKQTKLQRRLNDAEHYLRSRMGKKQPQVLLVLGSGLNHVAEQMKKPAVVPFADVPHLCKSTVGHHVGRFLSGKLGGKRVLAMQGRFHGYEGYTAQQVAFPVWLARRLGAQVLFTTNAAGGIAEGLAPGDFCVVSDHINFMGRNPVVGNQAPGLGPRFFSMEDAYDPALRTTALDVASELGIHAQEGVYLGLPGPSFETPAEIRMFATWGASTVAMSMCEEVIAARHVGMRVLGLNMISNYAAGLRPEGLNESTFDQEIARVYALAGENATKLVEGTLRALEL
ncbi:MAG: purine-nucleoside phosphorylase [Eggerthellaceae bacterium]|nr:purine-nucleoside phosphorylase [Eggerthellaceae bacterium]